MPRDPEPSKLKPAERIERERFLRGFFGADANETVAQLVEVVHERSFDSGGVLFRAGEAAEHIYFVVTGSVELRAEAQAPWSFGPSSMVGVLDVFLDRPRARTAVAACPTMILVLKSEDYFEILEDNFDRARAAILRGSAANQRLSLELSPDGGFPAPPWHAPTLDDKRALTLVDKLLVLRRVPPLEHAGLRAVADLAAQAEAIRVAAGELLFGPGQSRGRVHVVASGLVELERDAPYVRAAFGPHSFVAGFFSIGDDERAYRVRAAQDSVLLRIRSDDLFDVMEDHFELIRAALGANALDRDRLLTLTRT